MVVYERQMIFQISIQQISEKPVVWILIQHAGIRLLSVMIAFLF
jgi:hypothetical protein